MTPNEGVDPVADRVETLLAGGNGILRLDPAWVARDFLPPGRRLGLPEDAYDVGARGAICERWLASTTPADNTVPYPDEGLSPIATDGPPLLLADAVRAAPALLLGTEYAATHPAGLGRLAKLFDYGARLPFHIHPPERYAALVRRRPKDEAYHFLLGGDLGDHPETFLGVHPHLARGPREEALLPYLQGWDSDLILTTSQAYLQVPGEGFHVPSGMLHGPGTALTLELQEDSDVLSMFQALNAGKIISKELLYKDVRRQDRERDRERAPLRFVDWDLNGDPDLYQHAHLSPVPVRDATCPEPVEGPDATCPEPVEGPDLPRSRREWVFYGSPKFSGQRLTLAPGASTMITEPGVYSVFVWQGTGRWGGTGVIGGRPGHDELLIAHDAAVSALTVTCDGPEPLIAYLLSGPDLHPEAAYGDPR